MTDLIPHAYDAATALVAAGRSLTDAGLIAGTAGNLSARISPDAIVITPAGADKGSLEVSDLVEIDLGQPGAGAVTRASSELPFHLAAYEASDSVRAVIHTHAPALTALGLREVSISDYLPEVSLGVGPIARVDFHPSGSAELGNAVGRAVREGSKVLILHRHGAISVGATVQQALHRMELAELSAYTVLLAEDGAAAVDAAQQARLEDACARLLTDRG